MISVKEGRNFEELFKLTCIQQKISFIRIADGCRVVRGRGGQRLIRVKQDCDWVIWLGPLSCAVDTKSTGLSRLPMANMEPHQISKLSEICGSGGHAGFVIHFRKKSRSGYIAGNKVEKLISQGQKSISLEDCVDLGQTDMELGRDYLDLRRIFFGIVNDPHALENIQARPKISQPK